MRQGGAKAATFPQKDCFAGEAMPTDVVVYEGWETVLNAEVVPELRRPFREAILRFGY